MSNYLAIATITATFQRTLQSAIQADVDGARVTTIRPGNLGSGTPEAGVNVYLYDIKHNTAWRSSPETTIRGSKGELARRRLGLDLYYLLTFYGNEIELEPQRLLGSTISTFQECRIFTKQMILDTLDDSAFSFLTDSNLAEQVESIKLSILDLSIEDLSKIWSVFFQTPYNLSIAYIASSVLIDGEDMAQRALPVRGIDFAPMPLSQQPTIEKVTSSLGASQPILADSNLRIYGKQLLNQITQIRIGGIEKAPQDVSDTQINLQLSSFPADSLKAGVQSLQVIHQVVDPTQSRPKNGMPLKYRYVESNVAAFILRPTITEVNISNIQGRGNDLRSGELIIQTNLIIGRSQRVVILLNEWSMNSPLSYSFGSPPRTVDSNSVTIAVADVKAGSYLVRIQIDGAESLLNVDKDASSSTFNWYSSPKVVIS